MKTWNHPKYQVDTIPNAKYTIPNSKQKREGPCPHILSRNLLMTAARAPPTRSCLLHWAE